MDRDINNITVSLKLGHFNPVSHPYHVVAGQLKTGDKAEDSVFKNQQNDCSQTTEDTENSPGGLIGQG